MFYILPEKCFIDCPRNVLQFTQEMFYILPEKCFIDCRGASVVGKPVSGDLTCQPVTLAIHSAKLN